MNYNQNAKISQVNQTTLIIGIDIGSEKHYTRAFDWRGIEISKKVFSFTNDEEGFLSFLEWKDSHLTKAKKTNVIVGSEPTGSYWLPLAGYLKKKQITFVHVNPMHVKRSKEFDDNHPSKNDKKDPKTIAKLVIEGRYNYPYIPEGVYADLRTAWLNRERIVKEINIIKNRIERWFSLYFPEYKTVFGSWTGEASLMILPIAAIPSEILALGVDGINQIWRNAKLRAVGIKRAKTLYETAKRSIGCTEGFRSARMELNLLLSEYNYQHEKHNEIMSFIEELCNEIPGTDKLIAIKGIGLITVAGFLAEVGDIGRFDSPKQIQKIAGLALRENSSGKLKGQTTISKRGRSRLRALLFKGVLPLIANNTEFAELHKYFTHRSDNPLKKKQSVIAVCCKLIRVFYVILKKDVAYDPSKFTSDIKRKTA